MDPTGKALFKLLFNEGESVCAGNSKYSYHSMPLETAMNGPITLHSEDEEIADRYCESSDLITAAINPIVGFRKDSNVTAFRSFLWEVDVGSIKEQIGYFKKLGIPLSAQVFSGNKSVHAVTILDKDIVDIHGNKDEKTYRFLYQWALRVVTLADQVCKNPSRGIRIPGAYREPGKKQHLISIGGRVKFSDFMAWLMRYEHLKPEIKEKKPIPEKADHTRLSAWARDMLAQGIDFKKGRNHTWFSLGVDFANAGYSEDQAIDELTPRFNEESDFREKEFLRAIKSGFEYAERNE